MRKKKISFFLASSSKAPLASTRISVLNMLPYLQSSGWETDVCFEPAMPVNDPDLTGIAQAVLRSGSTVAYFQKVHGLSALSEGKLLVQNGVKTVYGVCDFVDNKMAALCDKTIVMTPYLKSLYDADVQHKIAIVHDGIERVELFKTSWDGSGSNGRLRAVTLNGKSLDELPIIGRPPRFIEARVIGSYPMVDMRLGYLRGVWWKLRSNANKRDKQAALRWFLFRPFKKVNWSLTTVYHHLLNADVGIIPVEPETTLVPGIPVPWWMLSSENRLTLMMGLGLPVVASPVPAYLSIIEQGQNGYIARSRDEWISILEELRDPVKRKSIGQAARETVMAAYSMDAQANKLTAVLDSLLE